MSGKSKSRGSGRESAQPPRRRNDRSRPTSAATIIKEDAPPYRVAGEDSPSPGGEGRSEGGRLRFIDLFCGIGGFRIAFERAGCECVFSSDWNPMAQITD